MQPTEVMAGVQRPYDPGMMVAILLYAYCLGLRSSRRIARALEERYRLSGWWRPTSSQTSVPSVA